ncbi:MAG TPA: hypothetical protein VND19_13565 [Acetobacteraceae bacterium]|nr:hypothetical protein [Acetobacteraceae bacterium]
MLRTGIIGAGIGGMTAAVVLCDAGFAVDVRAQAPEPTEVGGGIDPGPNAVRVPPPRARLLEEQVASGRDAGAVTNRRWPARQTTRRSISPAPKWTMRQAATTSALMRRSARPAWVA